MTTPIFQANTLSVQERVVLVAEERYLGIIELTVPQHTKTVEIVTQGPQGPAGDGTSLPPGPYGLLPESLTLTYTGDQLTSILSPSTTKTLSYDLSGSLHQLITTTGSSTVTRTFDYDANGRLTAVVVS